MTFLKLDRNVIEVKRVAMMLEEEIAGDEYKTRIKSDGKIEAYDTIKPA
jgi:hypothetical protein